MKGQPKLLNGEELCRLAKKLCAATDPKEVEKLSKDLMEGFYSRHLLPEELQPKSKEEWEREQQDLILKIRNGEAREILP